MEQHDEQFENYLREFQPQRPRALRPPEQNPGLLWRRFAAAAAVTLLSGMSLWFAGRRPEPAQGEVVVKGATPEQAAAVPLALFTMTQLALNDSKRLDAALASASRSVLPDFRAEDSTLRVLAKE